MVLGEAISFFISGAVTGWGGPISVFFGGIIGAKRDGWTIRLWDGIPSKCSRTIGSGKWDNWNEDFNWDGFGVGTLYTRDLGEGDQKLGI